MIGYPSILSHKKKTRLFSIKRKSSDDKIMTTFEVVADLHLSSLKLYLLFEREYQTGSPSVFFSCNTSVQKVHERTRAVFSLGETIAYGAAVPLLPSLRSIRVPDARAGRRLVLRRETKVISD